MEEGVESDRPLPEGKEQKEVLMEEEELGEV